MLAVDPSLQMWLTLALTGSAGGGLRARAAAGRADLARHPRRAAAAVPDRAAAPMPAAPSLLPPADLLAGFSSPALIAVSALLVVGEAMVATGALEGIARFLVWLARGSFQPRIDLRPRLRHREQRLPQQHADRRDLHADPALDRRALRPLARRGDDAALVRRDPRRHADADRHLDQPPGVGRAGQARRAAARLLRLHAAGAGPGARRRRSTSSPCRCCCRSATISRRWRVTDGKQFIAELDVGPDSPLIGETAQGGMFPSLAEVTVRLVQRGEQAILPPFEERHARCRRHPDRRRDAQGADRACSPSTTATC